MKFKDRYVLATGVVANTRVGGHRFEVFTSYDDMMTRKLAAVDLFDEAHWLPERQFRGDELPPRYRLVLEKVKKGGKK